jgi:hypothetical protein
MLRHLALLHALQGSDLSLDLGLASDPLLLLPTNLIEDLLLLEPHLLQGWRQLGIGAPPPIGLGEDPGKVGLETDRHVVLTLWPPGSCLHPPLLQLHLLYQE